MEPFRLTDAETQLAQWAADRASLFGLVPGNVKATYVWNPGGFVNRSFTVSDGRSKLHIKLASAKGAPGLRRWAQVHERLETLYMAPHLVGEIEGGILPADAFGLVFRHFDGEPLRIADAPALLPAMLGVIGELHNDGHLSEALGSTSAQTCADALSSLYVRRLRADIQIITSGIHLLPFVSADVITWCSDEIERLAHLAADHPAFQYPATAVTHRDPHWANFLVSSGGDWRLIDWDGLTANGDAALDFSILLWPLRRGGGGKEWCERVRTTVGADVAERLELYDRAQLLNEVIDLLADYVEAETYREYKERTQARARALHLDALTIYQERYERRSI